MIRFVVLGNLADVTGCRVHWRRNGQNSSRFLLMEKPASKGSGPLAQVARMCSLHDVAVIREFERTLTHGLPADPKQAVRAVNRRLVGMDERLREATVASSTARSLQPPDMESRNIRRSWWIADMSMAPCMMSEKQ